MRSKIRSDAGNQHQIYFNYRDFDTLYKNYDRGDYSKEDNPYDLLLCAKACFFKQRYEQCMEVLSQIRPDHSTKILYERQALMVKTLYLLEPQNQIKRQAAVQVYMKFKNKCPGRAMTPFHDSIIQDLLRMAKKHREDTLDYKDISKDEMRKTLKELQKKTKFEGLPSYLISVSWNQKYREYVLDNRQHPGPITNFEILNHIFEFEPHYQKNKAYTDTVLFPYTEDIGYVVVSAPHWKKLQSYFQGYPVKRIFVNNWRYRELNGNDMLIKLLIECENTQYLMQWQAGTFWERSVIPLLMEVFGPGQLKQKTRNDEYLIVQPGQISQPTSTLRYVRVDENIIRAIGDVEVQRKKKIFMCFDLQQHKPSDSVSKGVVGMVNLGNTCYLNAALQCLSHIAVFSHYFLRNEYLKNLNISDANKDGSQGEVTCALADIFKRLWFSSENTKYIDPTPFKRVFGSRFKDFENNDQQDAQEFLMFLLNCLHDDLNTNSQMRVSHRESMSAKTFEQVRNYNLSFYNRHNKSLISTIFHGFHYEEIICDSCKSKTYKFEDFLMKHLQVPPESPKLFVYYVSYEKPNSEADKIQVFQNGLETVSDIIPIIKNHFKLEEQDQLIPLMFHLDTQPSSCWRDVDLKMKVKDLNKIIQKKQTYFFLHRVPKMKPTDELFLLYYVYEDRDDDMNIDGYPRLIPCPSSMSDKNNEQELKQIVAETIIKADPDKLQLIKEVKCKKVKGSAYTTVVKVLNRSAIRNFKNQPYSKILGLNQMDKQITLFDCFNKLKNPQIIGEDEKWYCEKCSAVRSAHKTDGIYEMGEVLIIQLKRFTEKGKITTKVNYPLNGLDLGGYVDEKKKDDDLIFDLKGVVLHRGSLNSGHYTSYCRNARNNKWYHFDDEYVREVEEELVVDANAYILLYERSSVVA